MKIEMTEKLKTRLYRANNLEEVKEILCVNEDDDPEYIEEVEQIWKEIEGHRKDDDKELDLNELEAVSGGADRNWATEGCSSTVESFIWCFTNDYCELLYITYIHYKDPCMGNHNYEYYGIIRHRIHPKPEDNNYYEVHRCTKCGKEIFKFP